ncbi:MAG: Omp28-related outer membrane protein [Vicingaceae bacterium]
MKKLHLIIVLAGGLLTTMQSCSKEEIKGCTDAEACNFNPEANLENGSCTYATEWYKDLNGDGYGNPYASILDCNQPHGYTTARCNPLTFFQDLDGDGLGNPEVSRIECDSIEGYVSNSDDKIDLIPDFTQRAIMTYQGATWCGPCGANGDPTKEHLETNFGTNIIILNCQSGDAISSSSSFGNQFGDMFANSFSPAIGSIPHAYMSAANHAMTEAGFSSSSTQFDNEVNTILATAAKVGIAANVSLASGVVTVNTSVRFVSASGQHYLGVYLLEDGVMEDQVISGSPNAVTAHNNVLRAASSTAVGALGIESMGTTFAADEIVDETYTITVPSTVVNSANLQVAVVVWDGPTADKISNAIILDVD